LPFFVGKYIDELLTDVRIEPCMEASDRSVWTSIFKGNSSVSVMGVVQKLKESYWNLRSMRLLNVQKLHEVCVFDVGANYGQYAEMLR